MRDNPLWPELFDLFYDEAAEELSVEFIMDMLDVSAADVFRLVVQMDHELTEEDGIVRYTDESVLSLATCYGPHELYKWSVFAPEGSYRHGSMHGIEFAK